MKVKANNTDSATKILLAASVEFSENGLAGARVDKIADKAGLNKAMIYYHYGSKENLYRQVLGHHLSGLKDLLRRDISPDEDPEIIFAGFTKAYISMFDQIRDFVPLLLREVSSGGPQLKQVLANLGENSPALILKRAIEKGQASGQFRNVDWRQTAVSFIGMNLFYLMFSPITNFLLDLENEELFREKRAEAITDLFLNGLRKGES